MLRKKTLGVALVAAVAIAGVVTASASAIGWKVETASLGAGVKESVKETPTIAKPFVLKKFNGLTIECSTLKAKSAFIEGTNKTTASGLEFSGCAVTSNSKCVVEEPIETVPVMATLEAGPPVKLKLAPKEGTQFTTVTLKSKPGMTCAQAAALKIVGTATAEAPEAGTEKLGHLLNFTTGSGSSLSFGEETAQLTGEPELELTSGKKWSGS
jgi:hypothetical protein